MRSAEKRENVTDEPVKFRRNKRETACITENLEINQESEVYPVKAKKSIRQDTLNGKIERLYRSLEALSLGRYAEFDIYTCCDMISWLWKYRHITHEQMDDLTSLAIAIMEN